MVNIVFLDDSFPFDGLSPSSRALGGAEKAFASLPAAMARRGHQLEVYNHCQWTMRTDGVEWKPLETSSLPAVTDVLVVLNKPSLLKRVRLVAKQRVLLFSGPPRFLQRKATKSLLTDTKTLSLFFTNTQLEQAEGIRASILPPALRSEYLNPKAPQPSNPPIAIVTTHPAWGLSEVVRMWTDVIHPALPEAELHIYSAILSSDPKEEDSYFPLRAQIKIAEPHGVRVKIPLCDAEMSVIYREARVHLYPSHADDCTAFTLLESQACGLPAVLRPLGAAPERVSNGQSAYVVPDADAFANLTLTILSDDILHKSLSQEAQKRCHGLDWDGAAQYFDTILFR